MIAANCAVNGDTGEVTSSVRDITGSPMVKPGYIVHCSAASSMRMMGVIL